MDINAIMDAIGTALRTISGLRVYDYPADSVAVPAAIVSHPDSVEYDSVFAAGADRAVFQVIVLVGKVSERAARDQLEEYRSRPNPRSIKTALDGDLGGVIKTGRVMNGDALTIPVTGIEYAAATFEFEVFA